LAPRGLGVLLELLGQFLEVGGGAALDLGDLSRSASKSMPS
jgi:hypothetical protein